MLHLSELNISQNGVEPFIGKVENKANRAGVGKIECITARGFR
jgi:hypothetical protein